jgi:sugar phosphate isomerase/epimerase
LRALNGTIDLIAEFRRVFGSPDALRSWMGGHPVSVAMIGTSFRLHGNGPADRDGLLAFVEWAEALQTPWLRVFDGCKTGAAAEIDDAVATLGWWRSERERRGFAVDLVTETHDATAEPAALRTFLVAAPACKILWDAHHTWRRGGEAPRDTWAYLRRHVVHVHFKDSVTTPGAGEGYTYVFPGAGEFPLSDLVGALVADGYARALCLEWERMWHPSLQPIEAALDSLDRFPWWTSAGSVRASAGT